MEYKMSTASNRIAKLRELMKLKNIDAWIAPSADSHQSEYVAEHWKCRQWLSGFTGSAGTLVVTADKAGLWTDSRYFIQAEKELDGSGVDLFKLGVENVPSYTQWLRDNLQNNSIVGFDGSLLSVVEVNSLIDSLAQKQISLSYNEGLVDKIWTDRPEIPQSKILIFDEKSSGESVSSKISRIRGKMEDYGVNAHLFCTLDDIAWSFNIRGNDISYNPVVIAYAFISLEEAILFIDSNKLTDEVKKYFSDNDIAIQEYSDIFHFLRKLNDKYKIWVDSNKISQKIRDAIPDNCQIADKMNIATELKCIKNSVEIEGFKSCHVRDGVAMIKWLHWLDKNIGKVDMDEVSVSDELERFRAQNDGYKGLSFSTIVGYKENGAIVHYSAKKETAAELKAEGLLLVDSGAQYLDGTTDITRTISLGNVKSEEIEIFTTVLKGHIGLAKAIFPKGYTGAMIDTFSRAEIWQQKFNFGHGTGHGIGHFLNVHEGPHQIRPTNHYEIKVGMVTSNEPGIYLEGKFGIRIENLIVTVEKEKNEFGTFLGFDTITLCPIDTSLINRERLTKDEKEWLNNYHKSVRENLSQYLSEEEKIWLEAKTAEV